MSNILQRIQDAVSRGEIQNPLVIELCDEIGKTVVELPCVAMVEQSLQDGKMKPASDQKLNGRYAVVYMDNRKWASPLIDICGTPYNRDQAETRKAELSRSESALEGSKRHDGD